MKIEEIYVSPEHNYYGRGKDIPGPAPTHVLQEIQCDEGKGLVGDRYYGDPKYEKGQVTFIFKDYLDQLKEELNIEFNYQDIRRNILVSQENPLDLVGKKFRIGEAEFIGTEDCTPCGFWNITIAKGASNWLTKNNAGGLRAKILKSGVLRSGDESSIIE